MGRHKKEQWISGKEATAILKRNSGRDDIADSYIRLLARNGKIESRPIDGRTSEYKLSDVEAYKVERRDQGKGRGKGQKRLDESDNPGKMEGRANLRVTRT